MPPLLLLLLLHLGLGVAAPVAWVLPPFPDAVPLPNPFSSLTDSTGRSLSPGSIRDSSTNRKEKEWTSPPEGGDFSPPPPPFHPPVPQCILPRLEWKEEGPIFRDYDALTKCELGKNSTCSPWAVSAVIVLSPSSTSSDLSHVKDFLNGINSRCNENTMISIFTPGHPNRNCANFSASDQETILNNMPIDVFRTESTAKTYHDLINLYQQQLNCALVDPPQPAALTVIITNSDCLDFCLPVHISDIGNVTVSNRWTQLYYSGEWSEGDCPSASQVFGHFLRCLDPRTCKYQNVPLDQLSKEVEGMRTCPRGAGYDTGTLILIIGIPCLTMVIIAVGCAYFCYKKSNIRWRRFFLQEQLQKGNLTPEQSRALESQCSPPRSTSLFASESFRGGSQKLSTAQSPTKASPNHYSDFHHETILEEDDIECPWEIATGNLLILEGKVLGHGAFATVYKGVITGRIPLLDMKPSLKLEICPEREDEAEVAIKRMPPHADESARADFQKEILFMKSLGYHRHVTSLLGCVTTSLDPLLVVEFCHFGDLLRFLRSQKKHILVGEDEDCPVDAEVCLRVKDLVSIAWQIADGMSYLSSMKFIHRDLAARNVLLTKSLVAKISDFGLGRHVDSTLYMAKGGRLPLKWMPPEALKYNEFSQKSDVWSFGILLYEMFSLGKTPFPTVQPFEILDHVEGGGRPPQPDLCPPQIFALQSWCWQLESASRPTFEDVKAELTRLLNVNDANYGYIDLGGGQADRDFRSFLNQTAQNEGEEEEEEKKADEVEEKRRDEVDWLYLADGHETMRRRSASHGARSGSTVSLSARAASASLGPLHSSIRPHSVDNYLHDSRESVISSISTSHGVVPSSRRREEETRPRGLSDSVASAPRARPHSSSNPLHFLTKRIKKVAEFVDR